MNSTIRKTRLSREESKERTRSRLIEIGREHFLRNGLSRTTSEEISEDAGYSRGALHANFGDKEGLFLEVVKSSHRRHEELLATLLRSKASGEVLLAKLRETFSSLLKDDDFCLIVELECEALRNEKLRISYRSFLREKIDSGARLLEEIIDSTDIRIRLRPAEFMIAMLSCLHGLIAKQMILEGELSASRTRGIVHSVFDRMVYRVGEEEVSAESEASRATKTRTRPAVHKGAGK